MESKSNCGLDLGFLLVGVVVAGYLYGEIKTKVTMRPGNKWVF